MEIEGDVIRKDQQRDVALVKIPLSKLKTLALKFNYSEIGSKVYAIGAPTNADLQGSISSGIVSTYRKDEKTDQTMLQSDTIVNGGNSGGPLVNEFGEVVAITVSKIRDAEGISFFIPIDSAIEKLSINLPEK
ncbi:MAG: serine protease [Emcibacteraceae bacterium]|nr:serine protease [Emcibacteraceae bacterium]